MTFCCLYSLTVDLFVVHYSLMNSLLINKLITHSHYTRKATTEQFCQKRLYFTDLFAYSRTAWCTDLFAYSRTAWCTDLFAYSRTVWCTDLFAYSRTAWCTDLFAYSRTVWCTDLFCIQSNGMVY